jgi:oligopeptide transport system ATP-binding protein
MQMSTLLQVEDLTVRFHTPEGTVHAVNGISYSLKEGETLAIVGESGSGKSVSMMSMLRLIPIPPGEIEKGKAVFRGRDLLSMTEDELERTRGREISMVFQDPMTSLNPVLTIRRQIVEALRTHMAMEDTEADDRALELLNSVGIPDAESRIQDYPHQFSGGMRQRAMIAMALSCSPSILIADEPTTALDVTIQAQIVELALKLRKSIGMAIIWITHDLGIVAGIADRVIVMYAGYIVEQASAGDLYANPQHPYSRALIGALPRADLRRDHRLKSIPGAPPSMLVKPRGCPFAPRCEYAIERCWAENPVLQDVAVGHSAACWVVAGTGGAR